MFTRKDLLLKRTPKDGVDRKIYLALLRDEFYESKSLSAKEQVLANLANFAYDPVNYEYIREVCIIDVFLENLQGNNSTLSRYSLAGICNLCLDPDNRDYIVYNDGIAKIVKYLVNSNVEMVADAITTLQFLITPETRDKICNTEIINKILKIQRSDDARLRNLATIFLEDHCQREQVEICKTVYEHFLIQVDKI